MFHGAPGMIRTCDTRIRNPVLYPLSYGGHKRMSDTIVVMLLSSSIELLNILDYCKRSQGTASALLSGT